MLLYVHSFETIRLIRTGSRTAISTFTQLVNSDVDFLFFIVALRQRKRDGLLGTGEGDVLE